MPMYNYKGMTGSGKATKGPLNAENLPAARARQTADSAVARDGQVGF